VVCGVWGKACRQTIGSIAATHRDKAPPQASNHHTRLCVCLSVGRSVDNARLFRLLSVCPFVSSTLSLSAARWATLTPVCVCVCVCLCLPMYVCVWMCVCADSLHTASCTSEKRGTLSKLADSLSEWPPVFLCPPACLPACLACVRSVGYMVDGGWMIRLTRTFRAHGQ